MQPNQGDWEVHTRGIGSKLLEKWGYKKGEGLGKDNQGIAAPINVFAAPQKHMSLDHVLDYHNSMLQNEWQKDGDEDVNAQVLQFSQISLTENSSALPSIEELGSSLEGIRLNDSSQKSIKDIPKELTASLDKTIKQCKGNNRNLESEISYQMELIRGLKNQHREHFSKGQSLESEIAQLTKFAKAVKRLKEKIKDPNNAPRAFEEIKAAFPSEYEQFHISTLAENMLTREMNDELDSNTWSISSGILPTSISHWKYVVKSSNFPYFWSMFIPRFCDILSTKWKPRKDTNFKVLSVVEELNSLLPPSLFRAILAPQISHQLLQCISKWKPKHLPGKSSKVPLHTCLFVWGPTLGVECMDELFEIVGKKLVNFLRDKDEKWKMNDDRVIAILTPWTPLFQEAPMKKLGKVVLAKCISAVTKQAITKFVPNYKQTENSATDTSILGFAWEWIPLWARAGLVDVPVFTSILANLFFPKWCEFLIRWMKNGGDLDEIALLLQEIMQLTLFFLVSWYLFWRKLFQEEFLAKGYLVDVFMEVLRLMQENIPVYK